MYTVNTGNTSDQHIICHIKYCRYLLSNFERQNVPYVQIAGTYKLPAPVPCTPIRYQSHACLIAQFGHGQHSILGSTCDETKARNFVHVLCVLLNYGHVDSIIIRWELSEISYIKTCLPVALCVLMTSLYFPIAPALVRYSNTTSRLAPYSGYGR